MIARYPNPGEGIELDTGDGVHVVTADTGVAADQAWT